MIVLDTSAVIALVFNEPTASTLAARLAAEPERVMSTACYLEAGAVIAGRRLPKPFVAIDDLEEFLAEFEVERLPVDIVQIRIALDARIRFGRGMRHGGKLNLGDCFSYALAKSLDAPLLFVGRDFTATDIKSALA